MSPGILGDPAPSGVPGGAFYSLVGVSLSAAAVLESVDAIAFH
jgi:hypothetical protein